YGPGESTDVYTFTDHVTQSCGSSGTSTSRPVLGNHAGGGVGNLAVVWIYLHFQRRLKTMTDVYLLNLAVADLLFLVTLPLWAAEALHGWNFGSTLCKLNSALYKVNLFSSMLLLTCISVDRYVVIVQTTKAQNTRAERRRCSRLVCLALIFATTTPTEEFCTAAWVPSSRGNLTKIATLSLQVTMGFCLPFIIMAFCYSHRGHAAQNAQLPEAKAWCHPGGGGGVRISQLPYNAVLVVEAAQASNMTLTDCEQLRRFDITGQVLKSLPTLTPVSTLPLRLRGVRFPVIPLAAKSPSGKSSRSPLSSARTSVMSDCDTSQALSL
uniref:Chemokine (C-C motif) receptor 9a n=1 Tax=Sphaeramia orbicularis TaxID=375764 RepID=A0A673APS3_9TELE